MKKDTEHQLAQFEPGMLVRIHPSAAARGKSRHYGRGKVVAVLAKALIVRPFNHPFDEVVDPWCVKPWKSKCPSSGSRLGRPARLWGSSEAVA